MEGQISSHHHKLSPCTDTKLVFLRGEQTFSIVKALLFIFSRSSRSLKHNDFTSQPVDEISLQSLTGMGYSSFGYKDQTESSFK